MKFLIDHNLEGHAEILLGTIAGQGWLELLPIQFVTFKKINLPIDSSDRIVWRLAHFTDRQSQYERRRITGTSSPRRKHIKIFTGSYHR
jgi:hypothetical protein